MTGVYVPSAQAVNYTVVVQKAGNTPYGWTGVGVGSGMAGANMVVSGCSRQAAGRGMAC